MRDDLPRQLLGPDDPDPAAFVNLEARSPFLLIGDHAGGAIPASLGTLGLDAADLCRHIALDIGTRELGEALAGLLDATFVHQRYTRLVIDCNRDPAREDAMPEASDGTAVPGNVGLNRGAKPARVMQVHVPYHAAIAAEIARRDAAGRTTILVSLHSFTPRLAGGRDRPWQVGVLHDGGVDGLARALLDILPSRVACVGDNEPYRMDTTDYTVPRHAIARGLAYAEIEVRQDLIADAAGVAAWARTLATTLPQAAEAGLSHPGIVGGLVIGQPV